MFGSSLSVRSFVRLGSFQLYAGSTRVISATDAGTGTLHGEEWAPDREGPASQLLRELRPVAFKSESEVDAERRRFGFIAQSRIRELEERLTDLQVRFETHLLEHLLYTY
ncbi:hypothetical protein FOZ63_007550, partial [Perkinsus olseni]